MGTIVLLDLMGGVALLLWGLHMVRSGILRAFGSHPARRVALRPRGGDLGQASRPIAGEPEREAKPPFAGDEVGEVRLLQTRSACID